MKSERVYRILLGLYPSAYREEFGEAMAQCFRDQLRASQSRMERGRLWFRTVADLAATLPARHLERLFRHAVFAYDVSARRAMFFARYEALSFSGHEITLAHLVLGILREDRRLAYSLLGRDGTAQIRKAFESLEAAPRLRRITARHDIPLNSDCKEVLAKALNRARDSGTKVTPCSLLSAILDHDSSDASRLLREQLPGD